jgi:DNA ligase (NAD+)
MGDRIAELEREIRRHQNLYYNGEPEISDAEFDALWDELVQLDPRNELLATVGEDSSPSFEKRRHVIPMTSQDKAASPDAFLGWAGKVAHDRYVVQYKMDGASLELQYTDGRLRHGVTRGDGTIGDDITANVRRMQGALPRVDPAFTGAVRGEVVMSHAVHAAKYSDKANCRNAANGLMKRKDGLGSADLLIIVYDALHAENETFFNDELSKLRWLAAQGFTVVEYRVVETPEEVVAYREKTMTQRAELDFDIDGLVVKGCSIDLADARRPRPEKQIAFKFNPDEAVSTVVDVFFSESGSNYTPIGVIEPVRLAGTTVRRANLANPKLMESMGIKIGSRVRVTKRGDIIPKIEDVVSTPADAKPIELPTVCGSCGTELINAGTRLYCPNVDCPKRRRFRISRWLNALGIKDFGDVLVSRLFESGRVSSIPDLYSLTEDDITSFERMGEGIAKRALGNLYAITEVSLAQFLAGFNIEGIGELIAGKLIEAGYDSLDVLAEASVEDLAAVNGIGEITAQTIRDGVQLHKADMEALLFTGRVSITTPQHGPLAGKTVCFTGTLDGITRKEAGRMVANAGGSVATSVTSSLSYLVTNDPESGSSKNRKARELGVPILDQSEFLQLVGRGTAATA